jgi:hypothetical protein
MENPQRVDYRRALVAPFEGREWPMTLLWVVLGMAVPLVGPIVVFGYQAMMIERMAREGVGARYPIFELERLAEYLQRGLRMFIVSLLVTVVVTPFAFMVLFGGNIVAAVLMSRQEAASSMLGVVVLCTGVLVFLLLSVLAMALVTPLWIKAALERDLARVFDFGFARDFMRRTGRDAVVAHLFMMVLGLGLMIVGVLACFVGVFPAVGIAMLVQPHLYGQLYLLYLGRGGAGIPLPEPAAAT